MIAPDKPMKGARKKPPGKTQAERDAIALGRIETYMDALTDKHMTCPSCQERYNIKELPTSVVNLIKARYDKLKPSLSSVEQHNIEVTRPEADIISDFKEKLALNPDLMHQFVPDGWMLVRINAPVSSVPPVSQSVAN